MTTRRGFLSGILAAAVAPVFIKPEVLMPVRQIIAPSQQIITNATDIEELFRVHTYTGNGQLHTIEHSLGWAPSFILIKSRETGNWVQHPLEVGA
jgi:hypothetical protein